MNASQTTRFKVATEDWEFEAIHRLNHRTFVEEIPQHAAAADGRLVDRFHHQNTYIVALRQGNVIGMIALRGQRPFSLDAKLPGLDAYLPRHRHVCELRLLAVEPAHRRGSIFRGLADHVMRLALARG